MVHYLENPLFLGKNDSIALLPRMRYPSKPSFVNLSNVKLNRSVIIGLPLVQPNEEGRSNHGAFWVLKCCCSNYFLARSKTLKRCIKTGEPLDCQCCRHTRAIALDYANRG